MDSYLYVCARETCYDGEGGEGAAGAGGGEPKIEFTPQQQAKLNALLAEERRKAEVTAKNNAATLTAQLEEALQSKGIAEEVRQQLEASVEELKKSQRTAAEQLAHEKKKAEEEFKAKYTDVETRAKTWEQRFTGAEITRSLQDAAVAEGAFNPKQIVSLLQHSTKMTEGRDDKNQPNGVFELSTEFEDVSTEGSSYVAKMTPDKAVKRMKELPQYANLFKSNVVSGVGGTSTAGGSAGDKKVDLRNLTPEQYRELRKNNPRALGLA